MGLLRVGGRSYSSSPCASSNSSQWLGNSTCSRSYSVNCTPPYISSSYSTSSCSTSLDLNPARMPRQGQGSVKNPVRTPSPNKSTVLPPINTYIPFTVVTPSERTHARPNFVFKHEQSLLGQGAKHKNRHGLRFTILRCEFTILRVYTIATLLQQALPVKTFVCAHGAFPSLLVIHCL